MITDPLVQQGHIINHIHSAKHNIVFIHIHISNLPKGAGFEAQ